MNAKSLLAIPLVVAALITLSGCNNDDPKSPASSDSPEISLPVEPSTSKAPIPSLAP